MLGIQIDFAGVNQGGPLFRFCRGEPRGAPISIDNEKGRRLLLSTVQAYGGKCL